MPRLVRKQPLLMMNKQATLPGSPLADTTQARDQPKQDVFHTSDRAWHLRSGMVGSPVVSRRDKVHHHRTLLLT